MGRKEDGYWSNRSKSRIERAVKDSYHSSSEERSLTINVFAASFVAFWLLYIGQNLATSIMASANNVIQVLYPDRLLMGYNRGRFTVTNVTFIYATSTFFLLIFGMIAKIWIPRKRFSRSGIRAFLVYFHFWGLVMALGFMIQGMTLHNHFAWSLKGLRFPKTLIYSLAPLLLILLLRLSPYFQGIIGRLAISSEMAKEENRKAFFIKFFFLPTLTTLLLTNIISEFFRTNSWLFTVICFILLLTVFLYSIRSKSELRFHRIGTYKSSVWLWVMAVSILVAIPVFSEKAVSIYRLFSVHLGII